MKAAQLERLQEYLQRLRLFESRERLEARRGATVRTGRFVTSLDSNSEFT
jgi:hypothetical protein